jgi:hypothetical protein
MIGGATRFPEYASTAPSDSSNRLEDSSISTSDPATAFTRWNSITLFFGDVVACASAVTVGCFAVYMIETYWLGIPCFVFQSPYLEEQRFWLAVIMVAICGGAAYAGHHSERHPFHEDLRGILIAPLVGFVGCVEFAYKTSFSQLQLPLALLATLAVPLMRIAVRRKLTTSGMPVVKAAMIGLGRPGAAVKVLLRGAYLRYQVTSGGPPCDYAKDSNGCVGTRLERPKRETDARQVILVRWDGKMPNVRMIPYAVVPPIHGPQLARLATQSLLSSDPVLSRPQPSLVSH